MSLVEIARFNDVYEADLAAAFLESQGIEVTVADRFHNTAHPGLQRALGLRVMGAESRVFEAKAILARAMAGEFAEEDGDDIGETPCARVAVIGLAVAALLSGGGLYWGTRRTRTLRDIHWAGLALFAMAAGLMAVLVASAVFNPAPPPDYYPY